MRPKPRRPGRPLRRMRVFERLRVLGSRTPLWMRHAVVQSAQFLPRIFVIEID